MTARCAGFRASAALAVALAAAGPACAATITLDVRVPETTPPGATIFASGGLPVLGSWNGRGIALERVDAHRWVGRFEADAGTFVELKITRGSWETVEKATDGSEIQNRRHVVKGDETLPIEVGAWRDQVETRPPAHTITGDVRTHPAVRSRFLDHARDVWVWLPPGYEDDRSRRYPVLYMHDGQNVFDEATSFIGIEWGADETATRLLEAGEIAPFLIVAAANSPERTLEYTPAPGGRRDGRAADYARFLIEELKPFIDETYRTRPEARWTGTAGSSLGGLLTLYLGFAHPDVFTRLGAVSPAAFWHDHAIEKRIHAPASAEVRLWVDVGTLEGVTPDDHARWLEGARRLRAALVAAGFEEGRTLAYLEDEGAVHNEAAWAGRLDRIFRYLFPAGGE